MFLLSTDFPDIDLFFAEAEIHYNLCFGVSLQAFLNKKMKL